MSTRVPSNARASDDPYVGALLREVGADSVAPTPTQGMQARRQRREAKAAALHGPHTQSCTTPARVQNEYFEPLLSGREVDEEYVESAAESHIPNVWEQAAARHANAQHASTQHVNAQSAAGPSIVVTYATYAPYACVADCADAMADAWEDSAGCAQLGHNHQ